ncbi:hypothetical protein Efla_002796 [Eimeria flavescens]
MSNGRSNGEQQGPGGGPSSVLSAEGAGSSRATSEQEEEFFRSDIDRVVRLRGSQDMKYLLSYLEPQHAAEFRLVESKWAEEPVLNSYGCEYLTRVVSQRTPCGANRFVLLILFLLVIFIRGCTYWGWNGMQDMLYKSGAFEWRCSADPAAVTELPVGDKKYIDCPRRKNAINDLYTTAFAANFIFSVVGGYILDKVGPKLTLLSAVLMDVTGWVLLSVASEHFVSYVPALVFIGMASDPGYLSLICVANLFPKRESTIMGVMGSVRSLSFAVPVIMAAVFSGPSFQPGDLWKVLLSYILVGLGISLLVCLFFVPRKPFLGAEDYRREDREQQITAVRNKALTGLPAAFLKQWLSQEDRGRLRHAHINFTLLLTDAEYAHVQQMLERVEKHEAKVEREADLKSALLNPLFFLLLPVFVVNLLRVEFFTKSNKEQMLVPDGGNLYTLFSIMNILSFMPGPVMGYLSDRFGTLCVLNLLNVAGMAMYAFVMPNYLASKGVSVFCFWIYASFVLSSVYCYIKMHFPNRLFGTLAGACSLVGGCFALTSMGWYKLSTETLLKLKPCNFWPVDGVMIAGGLVVGCFLAALHALERRRKRAVRDSSKEEAADAAAAALVSQQPTGQEGLCSFDDDDESELQGSGNIELMTDARATLPV